METEQERLQKLYREMGDEHLLDMAEDSDDLTDPARLALEQELRHRGMTPEPPADQPIIATEEPERENGFGPGIPGIFPASASVVEQALEAPQPDKDGLSALISFYDGIELSKACAILEDAEIEPVIEPIDGDAQSGVPPRFEVWLDTRDLEHAKTLLRMKMGLFPLAETDDYGSGDFEPRGVVGVFDSKPEAEDVHTVLVQAGISSRVEANVENETYEVLVEPEDQERAVAVVASGMGLAS